MLSLLLYSHGQVMASVSALVSLCCVMLGSQLLLSRMLAVLLSQARELMGVLLVLRCQLPTEPAIMIRIEVDGKVSYCGVVSVIVFQQAAVSSSPI
jgi:hypothetical protein